MATDPLTYDLRPARRANKLPHQHRITQLGSLPPANTQAIGKVALRFQEIYWPAALPTLNFPLQPYILPHSY